MSRIARLALCVAWLAVIAGLLALGTWQVERRAWKLALIARVDAGLHAAPRPAPLVARRDDAYRRVFVSGRFLAVPDSFVQAVTARGPGWWVLTPLATGTGRIVLINRGFVAQRRATPPARAPVTVTGLLRLTEPRGGFLRRNAPAQDRWFSRDVAAIAARRGLGSVAPFFIDADAAPATARARPDQPIGGLTVVRFTNNHLIYAITWYMLALMAGFAFVRTIGPWRRRGARA